MRPAQKAPENIRIDRAWSAGLPCFNEAGAKSAGKRPTADRSCPADARSFNEAGAKSAGKQVSYRMKKKKVKVLQ